MNLLARLVHRPRQTLDLYISTVLENIITQRFQIRAMSTLLLDLKYNTKN